MIESSVLEKGLREFRLSSFRLGQREIITDVLNGNDVLGILPTGTGKSLCYQLPAKLLSGTTIIVSPLIALMLDQVKQLKAANFKEVIALNSFMNWSERMNVYKNLQSYKLIYISPELLQNEDLLNYLTQLKVSLFVVDEAHCISQWGHEFRPDYLKLASIIERLDNPPTLALSATATRSVQHDIMETLKRPHMIKHIYPIDKENITFTIQKVDDNQQKKAIILDILSKVRIPTIIYFSSRRATQEVSEYLTTRLPNQRIAFYHGGMDPSDRVIVQQQFMNDQLDVICCTSAFGMGIDKANIRLVIHYHLSTQIESYIQEVGRAGRDGKESLSILLYNEADVYIPKNLIENELPTKSMLQITFNKLYELYINHQIIPMKTEEIESLLGLNETQWRFLHYQLERHGIIHGSHIKYNSYKWKEAFESISTTQKERYLFKQTKLNEIIDWIKEENCLREQLYKSFQPTYKKALFQCCSNCGFSFAEWKPKQTIITSSKKLSWQEKLKELLLLEGKT